MTPPEYGAAHRRLLQSDAGDLFQKIVLEGAIRSDDPRVVEGGPHHDAFTFLVDLGLLALDGLRQDGSVAGPVGLGGEQLELRVADCRSEEPVDVGQPAQLHDRHRGWGGTPVGEPQLGEGVRPLGGLGKEVGRALSHR